MVYEKNERNKNRFTMANRPMGMQVNCSQISVGVVITG